MNADQPTPEAGTEEQEKAVGYFLVTFHDLSLLEQIGRELREKNLITGSQAIHDTTGDHTHKGAVRTEAQHTLMFAISPDMDRARVREIEEYIEKRIKDAGDWEVPPVIRLSGSANDLFRSYVNDAEKENRMVRRIQRRMRLAVVGLIAALGLGATIGGVAYRDAQEQQQKEEDLRKARKEEREKIYGKIRVLREKIEKMAIDADKKILKGKATITASEFGPEYVEEIEKMLQEVVELEREMRRYKDLE